MWSNAPYAGERVQVSLIAFGQRIGPHSVIVGDTTGLDEYGLLIEREHGGHVFIPWRNVSTVDKLTSRALFHLTSLQVGAPTLVDSGRAF